MKTSKNTRVAIIGAGLAGLTAAYLLQKQTTPVEVHMFEGSDRVGGRVRTLHDFDDNLYAEAGGMLFTDLEKEMLSLINDMDLDILSRPERLESRFYIDGTWDKGKRIQDLITMLMAEAQKIKADIQDPYDWSKKESNILDHLDSMSIVDFFIQKDNDANTIRNDLSATLLGLYADDFDDLSALDAIRFISQYGGCRELYSIKGGNDLLPKALAERINKKQQRIKLNCPVEQVKREHDKWKIYFHDKGIAPEVFDYVIMATPLTALQTKNVWAIQLPDLPKTRISMLNAIPYNQSVSRVYCQVNRRFWQPETASGSVITDQATCWLEDHTATQSQSTYAVLESHTGNSVGLQTQQAVDSKKAGEEQIAAVYGDEFTIALQPEKTKTICWSQEPFQMGNYPYFGIGQRRYLAMLSEPVINSLFFAGDYTAIAAPLSMNGAIQSAFRVVTEELLPAMHLTNTASEAISKT